MKRATMMILCSVIALSGYGKIVAGAEKPEPKGTKRAAAMSEKRKLSLVSGQVFALELMGVPDKDITAFVVAKHGAELKEIAEKSSDVSRMVDLSMRLRMTLAIASECDNRGISENASAKSLTLDDLDRLLKEHDLHNK